MPITTRRESVSISAARCARADLSPDAAPSALAANSLRSRGGGLFARALIAWAVTSKPASAHVPAGAVEVGPVRALAHDGFQVLGPDRRVGDRVLHHSSDDAGRDVGRAEHAVPEV